MRSEARLGREQKYRRAAAASAAEGHAEELATKPCSLVIVRHTGFFAVNCPIKVQDRAGSQMHIRDALIDEQTGAVLARGQIEFADAMSLDERFRLPSHSMILVDFNAYDGGGFALRPCVSFERLESGFCRAETKGAYLSLRTLSDWFLWDSNTEYAQLTGGCLCLPFNVRTGCYHVIRMEIETEFGEDGLAFKIEGELAGELSEGGHQYRVFAPRGACAGSRFRAHGTISWPVLKILGIQKVSAAKRFTESPAVVETVDRIGPGGKNLEDLVIGDFGFYVSGQMRFDAPSEARSHVSPFPVLGLGLSNDTLSFAYCGPLKKLSNGFYEPSYLALHATHNVSIWGLGKAELVRRTGFWYPPRQTALACQGDHLGMVGFDAAVTRGALQSKIHQKIASFDMRGENTDRGIHLDISGTLMPFEEQEYAFYMKRLEDGQSVEVRPWETFSLQADIPRALFIARWSRGRSSL